MVSNPPGEELVDSIGRRARKLRISVTDRCNFRCTFCMPTTPLWLPKEEILSFEEVTRAVRVFASLGIEKIRLTGGEPLSRQQVEKLVEMLVGVPGIQDVMMTTNGYLLREKAWALKEAGLKGVTVSLHSLKPELFASVTGRDNYYRVQAGIKAAKEAGLDPIKINAVIIRGYNDDEIVGLARLAHVTGMTVRFIEYMPFDGKQLWGMEKVVSAKEIVERIEKSFELIPLPREPSSTARNYEFADGAGEIAIISSITEPFCGDCDRIRLTAEGKIMPCMFDPTGYDLKPLLRGGASEDELAEFIRGSVFRKAPGVETLLKQLAPLQHVRPMHTIGG